MKMMNDAKLEKLKKAAGKLTIDELDKLPESELKATIVQAQAAMKQVAEELEANEAYQRAKKDLSYLTEGKKAVDKRQKAVATYCLHRLEEIGKDPSLNDNLITARYKQLQDEAKKAFAQFTQDTGIETSVEVKAGAL